LSLLSDFTYYLMLFFSNGHRPSEIYTLSLHDALPIWRPGGGVDAPQGLRYPARRPRGLACACAGVADLVQGAAPALSVPAHRGRSEEHTSELQSLAYLVCRLLLEKKKLMTSSIRTGPT